MIAGRAYDTIQGDTYGSRIKCVCLNARSIINKKNELNMLVEDIKRHLIGITRGQTII